MALPYTPLNIDVNDPAKSGLYSSFATSTKIAAPTQIRDNGLYLAIRAMEADTSNSRPWDDIDITAATVSVSIDNPDLFPTSGSFTLNFGPTTTGNLTSGSASVTITGSTAGIANGMYVVGLGITAGTTATISGSTVTLSANATASGTGESLYFYNPSSSLVSTVGASNLQVALNAIASIIAAGGVTATQTNTDFIVTWNNLGAQPLIQGNPGSLYPASSIQVLEIQAGSATLPEIQLIRILQQPATFQGTFTAFPGAGATVTTLTAGGTGINNLQQITLNPVPYSGTFTLTTSYGTSGPISATGTGSDVQTALLAIGSTPAGTWLVSGNSAGPYNITNTTGTSIAALTVNSSGLIVPIGMQGELNLATPGMVARFDALTSSTSEFAALLEVQLQFPGEDPQTILQVPVTVNRNVIRNGAISLPAYPSPATPAYVQAIIAALFGMASESVSAAGSDTPTIPLYCKQFTYEITAGGGSGAYTHSTTLPTSNRVAGDAADIYVSMAASTNPTISIVGTATESVVGNGSVFTSLLKYVFNGTSWDLLFRSA
jgi:hypothetical protein